MKIALVNPPWSFDGSIYFGCREPHLPLEYGYARALLTDAGHDAAIFDAQIDGIDTAALQSRVADFAPDMIVVTTAPSYLFWRCAPPELRIPQHTLAALDGLAALHGPGAEMEVSRGCPYHCTFCAKDNFRDRYRRRPLATILDELDGLIAAGASYVYFIDEIFLPWRELLEALVERPVEFGVQTRIDLWRPDMLDLLGRAGCVSIEAGVESLTPHGRDWLDKDCKLSTEELRDRLIHAKRSVPFVQANLIMTEGDDPEIIMRWREELQQHGVWANEPVPLFPYPGSPEYRRIRGLPDDAAWERALDYYLDRYATFSDIQEAQPRRLAELERAVG